MRADSLDDELAGLRPGRRQDRGPGPGGRQPPAARKVINKGLTEEDLARAAVALIQAGIDQLRLYFMVGLPTETLEDIREIARLSKYLQHRVTKDSRGAGSSGRSP